MGGHHLIKDDEQPSLEEQGKEEVIVKHTTSSYEHGPLRNESQDSQYEGRRFIKELVDHIEIDRIVVSIIFSHEVIEKRFP